MEQTVEFLFVGDSDIVDISNSIKLHVSGIDKISFEIIKYSLPVITPFFTHIINSSIGQNVFPDL